MKLVLVCTAVVLLMSAVELARSPKRRKNTIEQIYNEANITPVPKEKVDLYYGDYEVTLGMEVPPEYVVGLPSLGFKFGRGCYYTVILTTPHWPSSKDCFLSPYLLGLHANVYKNSDGCLLLEDSCEIATWLSPSPPPATGIHRYDLYVYEQNGIMDTNSVDLSIFQLLRFNFSVVEYAETNDLISPPAGGNYFTSQYQRIPVN